MPLYEYVRVCVCACVRACVRVPACVCVGSSMYVYTYACMYVMQEEAVSLMTGRRSQGAAKGSFRKMAGYSCRAEAYIYIYIYTYMCVCVFVQIGLSKGLGRHSANLRNKT